MTAGVESLHIHSLRNHSSMCPNQNLTFAMQCHNQDQREERIYTKVKVLRHCPEYRHKWRSVAVAGEGGHMWILRCHSRVLNDSNLCRPEDSSVQREAFLLCNEYCPILLILQLRLKCRLMKVRIELLALHARVKALDAMLLQSLHQDRLGHS